MSSDSNTSKQAKRADARLTPGVGAFMLLLLLMLPFAGSTQSHRTFHFSVPEGLPSSEVYEIYQDEKGFMWFATDNGVARYDGKEFELFHVKDGLTDPVVFGFFEDDKKRVWFRTFSGRLCYFDGDKIVPYQYNQQLIKAGENGFFNSIYDSQSEELWFTLERIYGKIDAQGRVNKEEVLKRSLFIKNIKGQLLQGADNHYSIKNIIIENKVFPIQLSDTSDFKFFNSIACKDKIYISIYRDLFEYHKDSIKKVFTSTYPMVSLSKDRDENLWIGYLNEGVEKFKDLQKGWRPEFLRNKSVTKVFQDHASGFWFSTLESGVYYVPDFKIENHELPATSRLKTVLALKDTVLAGDQSGKLFFLDAATKKLVSEIQHQHSVYGLFRDSFKNFWISAGVDLTRFDSKFKLKNIYRQRIATSFCEDPDGGIWTIGGIRISHFDNTGKPVGSWGTNTIYRNIFIDDSLIYLAGRTGLHLRDKEANFIRAPQQFSSSKITEIESINDTTLILATQGNGFFVVNKNNWNYWQYDSENQFVSNNIYCVLKTDSVLWMGTEKGLVAVNIESILKNEIDFSHLSERDGLLSDKINYIVPVNENIWAFSDNGFSVIPKSFAKLSDNKPIFYVKSIVAGHDTLKTRDQLAANTLILPYSKNHLTFTFGYISFTNQNLFLRYKISENSDWILGADRRLQFLSLAPGQYLLELQYSADNIHWNTTFRPLAFTVDAPWWLKWYTIVAAGFFILLTVYIYFRHRQSIYRQKNHYLSIINTHQQKLIQSEIETLERERKRIARELHDGVGTNLTAIKLMVDQLLQHHHEPHAADVEEQFQIALRELKDIIYGLTPPSLDRYGLFTALQNYISKLNTSLSPEITLQVFGSEIKNSEFNIMVFRIVQELITNSIKHSSAKNITIHINSFEDILNIVYEDDGIGFTRDPVRGGLGLDNIESRIQSMNGTFKFDSGDHGISYTIDIPLHSIRQTA